MNNDRIGSVVDLKVLIIPLDKYKIIDKKVVE